MPSVFSRRRASMGHAPQNATVSSSAAIAATSAFLKNSQSSASLSSAAAAAALRSHTTSPEPVGSIQTRRMVRRGSQSSNGSAAFEGTNVSRDPRQLIRRSSNGSMTQRSFRTPSPGGVSPSRSRPAASDAPPVPALNPSHTARSPPPSRPASSASLRVKPGASKSQKHLSLSRIQEPERENSQRQVNFSRPMSPIDTPPHSPVRPKTAGSWFGSPKQSNVAPRSAVTDRPSTSSGLSRSDSSRIVADLEAIAHAPPKMKKKKNQTGEKEGSLLAKGTMNSESSGIATSSAGMSPNENFSSREAGTSARQNSQSPSPSRTKRPTNQLHKQPSVVMELPEPDESKRRLSQDGPRSQAQSEAQSNGQAQHQIATPSRESTAKSMASSVPSGRPRQASLEVPDGLARSAHFSDVLVDGAGVRHNPPARSVSPAKSALKTSPSLSSRGNSPALSPGATRFRTPDSDRFDVVSITSQDGQQKKKAPRVSFDQDALGITSDTGAQKTTTSGVKDARMSSPTRNVSDDMDEMMQPRPALPSFGSVRSPARRTEADRAEKVTETISTPPRSALKNNHGTSSDHAIAPIIIADKFQKDSAASEPAPPTVTSVEGTGEVSDEAVSEEDVAKPVVKLASLASEREISTASTSTAPTTLGVPDITILPATPGIDDAAQSLTNDAGSRGTEQTKRRTMIVPGGWDDLEDVSDFDEKRRSLNLAQNGTATHTSKPAQVLHEDSDSDVSEAFSDAAEDPAELETFGYASLDAIVESPAPAPRIKQETTSPDPIPSIEPYEATEKKDWARTSAYWSDKKNELQRRESGLDSDEEEEETVTKSTVNKKSGVEEASPPKIEQSIAHAKQAVAKTLQTGTTKAGARPISSSAGSAPSGFRTTMRQDKMKAQVPTSDAPKGKVQTEILRSEPQSNTIRKTMRPMSAGNIRATPAPRAPAFTNDADSDSESSFKRKRRSSNTGSRYTMKKSMRSESVDSSADRRPATSQGFSTSKPLRPTSPDQSSITSRTTMRHSLRGIPEGPTLRGDRSMAKSGAQTQGSRFSMSGFSKSSKPSPAKASPSPASKGVFRSRFADSDSDDDTTARPAARSIGGGFRSRFVDSDDEDEPQPIVPSDFTPVRGIPRGQSHTRQASSDLEDSSEEENTRRRAANRKSERPTSTPVVPSQADIDRAMQKARQNVASMTGNQALLEAPSTPQGKMQKRVSVQPPPINTNTNTTPAPAPIPVAPEQSSTPKRSLLGSIFGRRNSSMSITSTTSKSRVPAATSSASPVDPSPTSPGSVRPGKLQRRQTPSKLVRSGSASSNLTTISTIAASTVHTPAAAPLGVQSSTSTPQMPSLAEANEEERDGTQHSKSDWPLPPLPTTPQRMLSSDSSMRRGEASPQRPATSDGLPLTLRGKNRPSTLRSVSNLSASGGAGKRAVSMPLDGGRMEGVGEEGEGTVMGGESGKAAVEGGVYSERTGKKKRFGRLRKAFGLVD